MGLAISGPGQAAERAPQGSVLDEYVGEICREAGLKPSCEGKWSLLVQAGMNDIDRRCDSFLSWMTERRRGKEPGNGETVLDKIMKLSGTSAEPFDNVAAAFGFPSPSQAAENASKLNSVERLTILQIVLAGRAQFRSKILNDAVPDRPAAVGLLRDYLQFCMPATIEAAITAR